MERQDYWGLFGGLMFLVAAVCMLPTTGFGIGSAGLFAIGSYHAGSALWKALRPPRDDE